MIIFLILDIIGIAAIIGLVIKMILDDRKFDKMIDNIETYTDTEDDE